MRQVFRISETVAENAALAGGILILSAALLVTVDIILRELFGFSLQAANELSGYAFAIGTAWAFAFVMLNRANVRIDVLYLHFPRIIKAILDVISVSSLVALAIFLTWHIGFTLVTSIELESRSTTPLRTPLWIPQILWFAGFLLFLITSLLLLVKSLVLLLRGNFAAVQMIAGVPSTEEVVEEEIASHTKGAE